jgi:hypothetical protein
MNVTLSIAFAAVDGVLLAAVAILGFAGRRARREIACDRLRTMGEADEIRSALAGLRMQLTEMKEMTDAKQAVAPAHSSSQPFVQARALTADQRAEALGMLRTGIGTDAVSATLCLPRAETALLQKVQSFLDSAPSRN